MTGSLRQDGAFSPMQGADQPGVRIVVCSSCRLPDEPGADPRAGAVLAKDVQRAAGGSGIAVSQVACLANCKRSLSAAVLRTGGWAYVFGDLNAASAADLVAGAKLLQASEDGLLPWRGRPESLKRGMVARIPPLSSLEDVSP